MQRLINKLLERTQLVKGLRAELETVRSKRNAMHRRCLNVEDALHKTVGEEDWYKYRDYFRNH